jgi:ribose transport system ATP-binding protein
MSSGRKLCGHPATTGNTVQDIILKSRWETTDLLTAEIRQSLYGEELVNDLIDASDLKTANQEIVLQGKNLLKRYGPTIAVNDVSIDLLKGEVLALVGANGAGKSTLIKVLTGITPCDRGEILIDGTRVNKGKYTTREARQMGIRVVHQELSLCKNMTVYENFYVELFQKFGRKMLNWRSKVKAYARDALDKVFPDNGIDVNAGLATLSIAQQQMVEIARAVSDPEVSILVLDEPTSSLPAEQTRQLMAYIKASVRSDVSYIYISHRLKEITDIADRIVIMLNGCKKHQCSIGDTTEEDMVCRMGDGIELKGEKALSVALRTPSLNRNVKVAFDRYSNGRLNNINTEMVGGEIVALTGLEGNGQLELLQTIFLQAGKQKPGFEIDGSVAYVAGDRKKEGIFPLWSISDNTIISRISQGSLFKPLRSDFVNRHVGRWNDRLRTKCVSTGDLITNLSGGNQQKVLIARAMAAEADIILLDDPTRGVDVATKGELYQVFQEAAQNGKLVIWRTSDDSELNYCTRLCVMNGGTIAGEIDHDEFNHSQMLKLAFQSKEKHYSIQDKKARRAPLYLFSLIAMIALYATCCFLSPPVFSKFGIELLAVGFSPFVFAALAQTFIIGLGHIDLSVGAFMGLVNVVCATVLSHSNALGLLFLTGLLLLYATMGLLIHWREIPSIIVTLSMSFVWIGTAYLLQDVPGGQVPSWMIKLFNPNNPVLQGVVLWALFFTVLSVFIYRSRYGTVLRGFGNNAAAMTNSGWSKPFAFWMTYLIAGLFTLMGGIAQSAITGASDVNASATYTLLTVAAVILGGGYFSGGVVTHVGAVFGGISLTMVNILLGLLRVSTDFTATIQGLVLLMILSLRLFAKGKR